MKPSVLVDIDGVLADCQGPLYAELHKRGYMLLPERNDFYEATSAQLQEIYNLTQPEAHDLLAEIWFAPQFIEQQPVRLDAIGAMRWILGLAEQVHIVTARTSLGRPDVPVVTQNWLNRYGFTYHKLVFEREKHVYAKEHGIHYVIEDNPSIAERCWMRGIGVFLVDHTYNRMVSPRERLWRVKSMAEIPKLMQKDWSAQQKGA